MDRLQQLLSGKMPSHILPFLWMHGEPHGVIREEIAAIASCGIGEICVESRPHPDFAGPHWWADLDVVMEEARARGMRVWVLDDKKFPTGYANGAFELEPEKAKWYLGERHMDLIGPAKDARALVGPFLPKDARLLAILALKRPDLDTPDVSLDAAIDLTETLQDGFVRMDLPEGAYRLFMLFTTQTGGGRPHYMNLIDAESVRVQIDAVYEPHYQRYRDDFGETFAGFFSDEPELGNTPGYDFRDTLGQPDKRLPWSSVLESKLRAAWGADFAKNLPALWYSAGNATADIRYRYMDEMTRLVSECFSGQIGAWCQARGVEYIGHIIEDDNAHGRMGCSVGHYFREQAGQHISGIDVVHHQIAPGFTGVTHRWVGWQTDAEFFHFGLAKLGSSAARLYPHMKGRALCEIFGNYGWGEGIGMMKWLTDHMLCRGINRFVPHAFSPTFPDRDCPPHFYARGNNPQFGFFKALMRYMNRLSFLFSGDQPQDAAVLYHADAEWGGEAMLFQKPARALMQRQIGFDVVPCDLLEEASFAGGQLVIRGNAYRALVIPGCDFLPESAMQRIEGLAGAGAPVFFAETRPSALKNGQVLPLSQIADAVAAVANPKIALSSRLPNLRFFHSVDAEGQKVYCFFNEDVAARAECTVTLLSGTYPAVTLYDAVNNRAETFLINENCFPLSLAPGEAMVLLPSPTIPPGAQPWPAPHTRLIHTAWHVSTAAQSQPGVFTHRFTIEADQPLPDLSTPNMLGDFVGICRYDGTFAAETACHASLYLPRVSDAAGVYVNGESAGTVLGNSGHVDITGLLREGDNTIRVEIATTLLPMMKDPVSVFTQLGSVGLLEAPILTIQQGDFHD